MDSLRIVYLAHPFKQDPIQNTQRVKLISQTILKLSEERAFSCFYAPLVPHLLLSVFNEEVNREIRPITEALSTALVRACDELWVVAPKISSGMRLEIQAAGDAGIPIKKWSEVLRLLPQIEDGVFPASSA